jgi:8-oxo-dGTP pyrophosphatase MutT (NUDIX family)
MCPGPGACREVLEETGVRAVFESVLAFRHAHAFAFNNSDLFFVAKYDNTLHHLRAPTTLNPDTLGLELRWMVYPSVGTHL